MTRLAAHAWPQVLDRGHSPGPARCSALAAPRLKDTATPQERHHAVADTTWGHLGGLHAPSGPDIPPKGDAGDAAFISLQSAYRPCGGLATGEEVAARLHVNGEGGHSRLARWIVGRQVFSFVWHEHFWLPMFQFEGPELSLREGLRPVLSEMINAMDGWSLAVWFALPNAALEGHSPLSVGRNRWSDVVHAARLQRHALNA